MFQVRVPRATHAYTGRMWSVNSEQTQQFADSLLRAADEMWERYERCARLPIIHPRDVLAVVGPAVGELQGTARAIEWHARNSE